MNDGRDVEYNGLGGEGEGEGQDVGVMNYVAYVTRSIEWKVIQTCE